MFPELLHMTLYRLNTYHDNGESHTFISTKIVFNINKYTFQKQNWKKNTGIQQLFFLNRTIHFIFIQYTKYNRMSVIGCTEKQV